MAVPAFGGTPREGPGPVVGLGRRDRGPVTVRTTMDGQAAPARLAIRTGDGHPIVPDAGQSWFDGQNGLGLRLLARRGHRHGARRDGDG